MPIYDQLLTNQLPLIPDAELARMFLYFQEQAGKWPLFSRWLSDVLTVEMGRRQGEHVPPDLKFAELPNWTDCQLAEALEAATVFSYAPRGVSEPTAQFVDAVVAHVTAFAAGRLRDRDFIATVVRSN
jgi:hypothetical protein